MLGIGVLWLVDLSASVFDTSSIELSLPSPRESLMIRMGTEILFGPYAVPSDHLVLTAWEVKILRRLGWPQGLLTMSLQV